MDVVHISATDGGGGATRAAMRQHRAASFADLNSIMMVLSKVGESATTLRYSYAASVTERFLRKLKKIGIERAVNSYRASRPDGYELFSDDRVHLGKSVATQVPLCDVINLHWVAGFVDFRIIFEGMLARTPLVWTLHDMNAFTGGCHFDHGCGRYVRGCGCCPQLGSDGRSDLSSDVLARKKQALAAFGESSRFSLVAPSEWLAKEASRSAVFSGQRVEVIPYGLDTEVFCPRDKESSRQRFNIDAESVLILFLATGAGSRRKGFEHLDLALQNMVCPEKTIVVSVGGRKPESSGNYTHVHLGTIKEDYVLAEIYSMADVFVIPAVEDNLPLACQEALACGTPVIGYDTGGIPDMVIPGKTGMLVERGNISELGDAIAGLITNPQLVCELSGGAREHALRNYTQKDNAQAYRRLYESLV